MATTVPIIFKPSGHKKTERAMGGVASSAKKLAKVLGPLVLGAAIFKLGKSAISTAGEFEALKTRLTAMTGSVQEGTKLFDKFNKVAATTPFAVKNVVEAGASLQAFGVNSEKMIKPVSDLAAFMGLDIVDAAGAMGRAFAGGAGAADILRERGILQLIKDTQGIDDLTKLTLPEFRKALEKAMMDPDGKIAGATALLAETWQGKLSNMQDAWSRLLATVGDKMLPFAKDMVTKMTGVIESWIDTVKTVDWGATLNLENVGKLFSNLGKAISNIFGIIWKRLRKIGLGQFKKLGTDILGVFGDMFSNLILRWEVFSNTIDEGLIITFETLSAEIANFFIRMFNKIKEGYNAVAEFIGMEPLDMTPEIDIDTLIADNIEEIMRLHELLDATLNPDSEEMADNWEAMSDSILEQIARITEGVLVYKDTVADSGQVDGDGNIIPPGGVSKEQVDGQFELFSMMFKGRKKYQEAQAKLDAEAAARGKATFAKNLAIASGQFKEFKELQKAAGIAKILQIIPESVTTAYNEGLAAGKGWASIPTAILFAATALAAQMAQLSQLKSAAVGFSGQVTQPTTFLVGENGPENVEVTPLNAPNVRGGEAGGGGGQNINIVFEGNVMDEDYIIDTAIPMIRDAVRRGETLVD